ncbi:hypothetical protein D049_3966B, partial [Vibrio parahaemolyticus VPTS-2010]
VQVVCVST